MNDQDKEAFEKWWDEIRLRGQSTFGIVAITWQAACEYKQKEIDRLQAKLETEKAKSLKLVEALEFYAETGNWTRSLEQSSALLEINDEDVSWTDTGGTYGEILSGGKRARQCLKELENK